MRNFFQAIPDSLEESAKVDGYNDILIFFKIILPLSLPSIATISLFYAVSYWNEYMNAILYLNDSGKWPIQVLLRQIVIVSSGMQADATSVDVVPPAQTIKMAVIAVATVPMLIVYPFLQKYFVKGAFVGSVKA
jgi:putative aldouronate transport system permease protein